MFKNIQKINYKNYRIDDNLLLNIENIILNLQDLSEKNKLKFFLIGHLSLILLSNKIYRNPEDIDIMINNNELSKWLDLLKNDWDWNGQDYIIDALKLFLNNKFKKFAAKSFNYSSFNENEADLYHIKNKVFSIYKRNKQLNIIDTNNKSQPQFIVHDPEFFKHIQIKDNLFKIFFYTNYVTKYFTAFIIFYDENLNHKEIIECSIEKISIENNTYYTYFSSPFLKLENFNKSFYRIFIQKKYFILTLQNKYSNIKLEIYVNNNLQNIYNVPIKYLELEETTKYIEIIFNKKNLNLTYPLLTFKHKLERIKDLDDYFIYGDLLKEYPLTNS